MIKILGRLPRSFPTWALILLTLTMGCSSFIDPNGDSNKDDKDFSGKWKISEELTGCDDAFKIEYSAEITQEGDTAQLKIGENMLKCDLNGDELSCTGELQLSKGVYRDFDEIIIWFKGDDQLEGTGTWMAYSVDNGSCPGSSVFSIKDESSDSAKDFSGTWDIREKWQGCDKTGVIDYAINIKQDETQATLFIGSRSLECAVNGNELRCAGERYYENGTFDTFSEYTLRFNDQGQLEGNGSWTYHETGEEDCSGISTFSLVDADSDDLDEISFEGAYEFFLNIDDCQGYRAAENAETYMIFQNGTTATFSSADDRAFSFDCQVTGGELQCAGASITMADSDEVWEISQLTFSHDSRNDLTGMATGIVHAEDGSECPGTYYFSTISQNSGPTASFSGSWNINEVLLGCTTSITADYPVDITQNGTNATINLQGEVFDCTVESNELICTGAFHGGNGTRFDYSEFRLWFNEDNLLDGIARWTLYEGSNAVCIGNSTLSATPTVNTSRSSGSSNSDSSSDSSSTMSIKGTSGRSMSQYLLIDSLLYGASSAEQ